MRRLTLASLVTACLVSPAAAGDAEVRLYLPRSIWVDREAIRLGDVSVITCNTAEMEQKVSGIALGRAPLSGERIEINRATVLARLATRGIERETVRLTGAASVSVRRKEQTVVRSRWVKVADAFLAEKKPGPAGCNWQLLRKPTDASLPASGQLTLTARLDEDSPHGYLKVVVEARRAEADADAEPLEAQSLLYKLVYPHRRLLAAANLPAGTVLSPENTTVDTVMQGAPAKDAGLPYGQRIRVALRKDSVIERRTLLTREAARKVVVKRNQSVVMKIEGDGFRMTCLGVALEDGKAGEFIKVRNRDSKRIVVAKVSFDGSVQPLYDEVSK